MQQLQLGGQRLLAQAGHAAVGTRHDHQAPRADHVPRLLPHRGGRGLGRVSLRVGSGQVCLSANLFALQASQHLCCHRPRRRLCRQGMPHCNPPPC